MYLQNPTILKSIFHATLEDSRRKRGGTVKQVEKINFNTSYSIPLRTPKVNLLKLVNNTQDEIRLKDEKIEQLETNVASLLKLISYDQDEMKVKDEKIREFEVKVPLLETSVSTLEKLRKDNENKINDLEAKIPSLESNVLSLENNKKIIEGHNTHLNRTLIKMCVYAVTKGTDRVINNYTPRV